MSKTKKILLAAAAIIIPGGGVIAGFYLLREALKKREEKKVKSKVDFWSMNEIEGSCMKCEHLALCVCNEVE